MIMDEKSVVKWPLDFFYTEKYDKKKDVETQKWMTRLVTTGDWQERLEN